MSRTAMSGLFALVGIGIALVIEAVAFWLIDVDFLTAAGIGMVLGACGGCFGALYGEMRWYREAERRMGLR